MVNFPKIITCVGRGVIVYILLQAVLFKYEKIKTAGKN